MAARPNNKGSFDKRGISDSMEIEEQMMLNEELFMLDPKIPNSVEADASLGYKLAPGEYLLQCPYDKSHRILSDRMGRHIDRCRNNHRMRLKANGITERFLFCPWDEAHLVPEIEFAYHSAKCPSRFKPKDQGEDARKYAPTHKALVPPELQDMDEDWDSEPSTQLGYNPQLTIDSGSHMVVQPTGLNKTAKRQQRELQRYKYNLSLSQRNPRLSFEAQREQLRLSPMLEQYPRETYMVREDVDSTSPAAASVQEEPGAAAGHRPVSSLASAAADIRPPFKFLGRFHRGRLPK